MTYDVVLVDGSSYLFRAYHALPPLVNAEGTPTGAIYGVLNMMKRLEKDYPGVKIIVVFDPKGGTFRNEMYSAYKADRQEMPGDLAVQIPVLQNIIVAQGFPLLIMPGYEADDVIASLVAMAKGKKILISTLDKDLAQLVTDNVHIINTMHNKLLDPERVFEKFQVHPEQIKDYLALMGDKSDNVPGITGVGPKTAAKWLGLYQTIAGVKENQHLLKGKVGENFRREIGQLDLSYQLVSLVEDLDVGESLEAIQQPKRDIPALQSYFQKLGFSRWLSELSEQKTINSIEVRSVNIVKMMLASLKEEIFVGYRANKSHNALLSIAEITVKIGDKIYYCHEDLVSIVSVCQLLTPALKGKRLVVFDAKVLLNFLRLHKICVEGVIIVDVMLAGYVLDSASAQSLSKLVTTFCSTGLLDNKGDENRDLLVKDVSNIAAVYPVLNKKLIEKPLAIYNEVELPLMSVLVKMEQNGILVDTEMLKNYAVLLKEELHCIETKVKGLIGQVINLSSPKQLAEVLFKTLKLPVIEKTQGGVPSTSESVLQALKNQHPVVPLLLSHRTLSKIVSTYAEALPKQVMSDGRIHGVFNQAVTVTGRLSSTNPNLQNIPIKTEYGRKIRQAFIPKEGYTLVAADYSQIELRIMAHISKDEGLVQAFNNGEDVHAATAAKIDNIAIDAVTPEQRRRAKIVNFGLIYGMSAFGLSKQLGVDRKEATMLIERYFQEYPGVLAYMEKSRELAEKDGYVETLIGRRILMPGAQSKNSIEKQAAIRAAINAPMQGTASDMIKKAMIVIDRDLINYDYSMVLQVHDELLFEVKVSQLKAFEAEIKKRMEAVVALDIPLLVNIASGDNWDDAHG